MKLTKTNLDKHLPMTAASISAAIASTLLISLTRSIMDKPDNTAEHTELMKAVKCLDEMYHPRGQYDQVIPLHDIRKYVVASEINDEAINILCEETGLTKPELIKANKTEVAETTRQFEQASKTLQQLYKSTTVPTSHVVNDEGNELILKAVESGIKSRTSRLMRFQQNEVVPEIKELQAFRKANSIRSEAA